MKAAANEPQAPVDEVELTADLLRRYDRPVPRYTSYPTAPHFKPAESGLYRDWLGQVPAELVDESIALLINGTDRLGEFLGGGGDVQSHADDHRCPGAFVEPVGGHGRLRRASRYGDQHHDGHALVERRHRAGQEPGPRRTSRARATDVAVAVQQLDAGDADLAVSVLLEQGDLLRQAHELTRVRHERAKQVGEIFGASLGVPASETALEGAALDLQDALVDHVHKSLLVRTSFAVIIADRPIDHLNTVGVGGPNLVLVGFLKLQTF